MPAPEQFVLINASDRPIYIQLYGGSTEAYCSIARNGTPLPFDRSCALCDCGACLSCAVCGRSLAGVLAIQPGDRHTWTWDGRMWPVVVSEDCHGACQQEQLVVAGVQLQLAVTYSFSFSVSRALAANEEFIGAPHVVSATFTHGSGSPVAVAAVP